MNDSIYQLEQDINNNKFDNESLLDIHCGLGFLQDAIAKAFIKKLDNGEPLSSKEILIIFNYLCLDDISAIEYEIDVLDSITTTVENNNNKLKESVYFYNLIDSYRKAVNTIVVYYSGDSARFDSDIAFLAKKCCERICKISNADENKLFYKNAMKELAEAYVQHIQYLKEEAGYSHEDYLRWYEEVLILAPDNITALKEIISMKSEEQ